MAPAFEIFRGIQMLGRKKPALVEHCASWKEWCTCAVALWMILPKVCFTRGANFAGNLAVSLCASFQFDGTPLQLSRPLSIFAWDVG